MADLQVAMLLSMGYPKQYIERAIDVHKKSKYGTNWNLSILVEIIVRLQEKDEQQLQLFQIPQSKPPNHNHNQNSAPINHHMNYNQHHEPKKQASVPLPLHQSCSQDEPENKEYYGFLNEDNYNDGLSSDDSDNAAAVSPGQGGAPRREAKEDAFAPHYVQIEEPLALKVNDFVDYRYENGRYLLCKIIAKSVELNHMMLLHPVGKPIYDTKYDRLVDIYQEYFKLSPAKSICLRKIECASHTLFRLRVGDYIDINPFCNGHRGWKNGKIIKLDPNSSQIKAVYHNETDDKNYSFWFHLLNTTEVAEFRTQCKHLDKHQLNLEYASIKTARHTTDDFKQNINNLNADEYEDKFEEQPQKAQSPLQVPALRDQEEEEEDVAIPQYADEDDVFLTQSLSCPEVTDDEIAAYLLKLEDAKWEFNSPSVDIYRLQCNQINHAQMLPHPLDIRFPQYFSTSTIPPKKQFFANVLPPKNKETFATKCRKWKIRVIVEETTATRLIGDMVTKLKNSLNRKDIIESEFMLKVVGCEEYMLYDENRLIIDYEAVRKAVRNEDNVMFQLLHCPALKQIERECFSLNMRHISKYKTKYLDTKLLTAKIVKKHEKKLKYCKYAFGEGKSWKELAMNNGDDSDREEDSFDIPLSQFAKDEFDSKEEEKNTNKPLSNIPSMADTLHLLDTVIDNESNERFFHTWDEPYSIKILFLVNVTQFPLYKHHVKSKKASKKWAILIRHELWIGDLQYAECTFDTDLRHPISDGMRFTGDTTALFESKKQKYCDLARESCISFTVYLCKLGGNSNEEIEEEIAIAFARFPLISEYNVMRKGKYSLNLWPIPLFVDYYKGPKCDAYGNLSFRYRGPTIDRHLKRLKKLKKGAAADTGMELQNVFKIGIEFAMNRNKKEMIIALPLNYRWDYKKGRNCKQDALETAQKLVNCDLLHAYDDEEKQIIWKHRDYLCKFGSSLTAFLRCVDWRDPMQRSECYDYVEKWQRDTIRNEDLLQLLSYEFSDNYIREWCVMRVARMSDNEIQMYLLQMVQCLKYELHHNNALIRLLMRRALANPNQIGHFLFWHLKSEYLETAEVNLHYVERIALYLEEYLLFARSGCARDLLIECNLSRALMIINNKLRREKKEKKSKITKERLREMMMTDLHRLTRILPGADSPFILPIESKYRCCALIVEECKLMSSAQMPLWLTFRNVDDNCESASKIEVIFKAGDDLRQDILTLSMIRVLDAIWLDRGLNLNLLPYNVVSTGDGQGMVECVSNAATTTHIHTKYGGGAQKGARDETTHLKYLYDCCGAGAGDDKDIASAIDIYTRSCAGYCIASYIFGLGDRHPSNIMVRRKGELFHIDFSHFLGNFKSQKVIGDYVKWQREVAPFVFLSANKFCITNGNTDENKYNEFMQFASNAYLAARRRHKLLINLFILMLPSQMPELIVKNHIAYLRDQLHLDDVANDEVLTHIHAIINVCLNDKRRIMDNMIHAMVHQ